MRRLLAADFGIWPMLQNLERASDQMVLSHTHWSRLANYLLLYDQVVVPTGNLQILPVLRIMLGKSAFDELLRSLNLTCAPIFRRIPGRTFIDLLKRNPVCGSLHGGYDLRNLRLAQLAPLVRLLVTVPSNPR
jgi:hypothetical protein